MSEYRFEKGDVGISEDEIVNADIDITKDGRHHGSAIMVFRGTESEARELRGVIIEALEDHYGVESPRTKEQVLLRFTQLRERKNEVRETLTQALAGVTTFKQFRETFPDLASYLPPEEEQTRNLPMRTDVMSKLRNSGWPAERKAS